MTENTQNTEKTNSDQKWRWVTNQQQKTSILLCRDGILSLVWNLKPEHADNLEKQLASGATFEEACKVAKGFGSSAFSVPCSQIQRLEASKHVGALNLFYLPEGTTADEKTEQQYTLHHSEPEKIKELFHQLSAVVLPDSTPAEVQLSRREAIREPLLLAFAVLLLGILCGFLADVEDLTETNALLGAVIKLIGPIGVMLITAILFGMCIYWMFSRLKATKLVTVRET